MRHRAPASNELNPCPALAKSECVRVTSRVTGLAISVRSRLRPYSTSMPVSILRYGSADSSAPRESYFNRLSVRLVVAMTCHAPGSCRKDPAVAERQSEAHRNKPRNTVRDKHLTAQREQKRNENHCGP